MTALDQLLVVQGYDTTTDQLRHRRDNLPERAELTAQQASLTTLQGTIGTAEEQRHELERDEKRLEDEVGSIEAKIATENEKLYGGGVTAIKELQALQDEIASLQRRQLTLEDGVLELMELIEPVEERLVDLGEQRLTAEASITAIEARIDEVETEIDAELSQLESERATEVAGIPEELLGEYQRLRSQLGGVAVAELKGATCMGCHLGLSAVEIDRIRKEPADSLIHCGECGRLLVR